MALKKTEDITFPTNPPLNASMPIIPKIALMEDSNQRIK
jgi:hypothetical protein